MDQNFSYVSCIKIQGVPILPPLITAHRRQELLEYKRQALLIEKQNSIRKSNFGDGKKLCLNNSLESEGDASILSNTVSCNIDTILNQIENPMKYVPFNNENVKKLNLTSSIIDVSEYSLDMKETFESQDLNAVELIETDTLHFPFYKDYNSASLKLFSGSTEIVLEGNVTDEKEVCERPRLKRSNSYTLDNPSPLLLAHLKRQSSVSLSSDQGLTDSSHEEIESARVNLFESCNTEGYNSQINNMKTSADLKYSNVSKIEETLVHKGNKQNQNRPYTQPTVEVITTDITVQEINITTPINNVNSEKNYMDLLNADMEKSSNEKLRNCYVEEDTDSELKSILKQIPEIYSSKILEIIEKQKVEQQKIFQNYETSSMDLTECRNVQNIKHINEQIDREKQKWHVNSSDSVGKTFSENLSENIEIIRKARSVSDCTTINISDTPNPGRCSIAESQSLYFDMSTSCSEPLEDVTLRTVNTVDQGDKCVVNNRSFFDTRYLDPLTQLNARQNAFGKISPVTNESTMKRERENKAASVIGAYVKGYLVRRLMRTARVQTLIQTIQDALLCALELQGLETIEEADVELHRRLIQQVSAACYEFHDVFFALNISEQMDLIAIDREKKRKILPVRTTRSSIDFLPKRRSSPNSRLTKSLTKFNI